MSSPQASPTVSTLELVTQAQLQAAEAGAVVAQLPATVVEATGSDAASFLHGQLANDVSGLQVGGVNRSLALNHRGHAEAEASVLRRGAQAFSLAVDGGGAQWLVPSLEGHIIFDDVKLRTVPDMALLSLQGAGARGCLPEAPVAGTFAEVQLGGASVVVVPRDRSAMGGFDLLVDANDVDTVLAALASAGATRVSAAVITALRIRGVVPAVDGEGGDGVLPQEAALEHALSYRKGCYLGQEIMARIEARGNLRRGLARLTLSAAPSGERQIKLDGRTVGVLGSVALVERPEGAAPVVEALAVLRADLPADAQLEVGGVVAVRA